MNKILIGAVVLGLAGGGFWYAKREGLILRDEFAFACDEAIKERLGSPSTYKVIRAAELVEPATDAETAADCASFLRALKQDGGDTAICENFYADEPLRSYKRVVRYESANTYGTPTASAATCSLLSRKEREALGDTTMLDFVIKVDGQTTSEWRVDQVLGLDAAIRADRELLQRLESGR